jgi:hypothetical protein
MSEILPVLSEPIPASAGGHVPGAGFRGRTRPPDTAPQAYAHTPSPCRVFAYRPENHQSRDTVYHLFQSSQLPGRKVGRKWVTTKSAVIRWLEDSSANDSLTRAVERGDRDALAKAIGSGKARFK